jgi:two-component system, NarL family, sensor histidine kinase DesK
MARLERWELIGRMFMSAWVLFAAPAAVSIATSGLGAWQLAVVAGFVVWAAVWVWFWMRALGRSQTAEVVGWVGLTVLLAQFSLIQPQPAGTFLVFSFIVAGVIFPLPRVGWVMAALVVLQLSLLVARQADPATAVNNLINSILVGGVGIGGRLLWLSYGELVAAREEIARLAVSEERLRFARDVHDLLGQSLAMIVLKSELAARQLPADADDSLRQELRDVARAARSSLGDLRDAVAGYRRPTLQAEISSARTALRTAGIDFTVDDRLGPLPAEQDSVLAWCMREAVTNVLKHSGARSCTVRLSRAGTTARLQVTDDGRGAATLSGGSGLVGIRERIELAGGTVEVSPEKGRGFELTIAVPAPAAAPVQKELAAS